MKINTSELVQLSVYGEIISAVWPVQRSYRIGGDGVSRVLPGTGGICYSHLIGDTAINIKADHVELGVTIKAPSPDENAALNTLACVGNEATVITGSAKGARGTVCGFHGGVEHVMIDFSQSVLDQLVIGDKVQVRAYGAGLELTDFSAVVVMNSDMKLLEAWGLKVRKDFLEVPVTHLVPGKLMGSGIGSNSCYSGDCDIQLFDTEVVNEYNLSTLRFGDLVAITDVDHTFGRRYLGGSVSVGVIVYSKSDMSGHGPGVTTLLTSAQGRIKPVVTKDANIGHYLGLGRWRKKRRVRAPK